MRRTQHYACAVAALCVALLTCVAAEDAAITAAYRQMSCRVDKVHYPNSTKDVAAVVANYYELAVAVNATVKLRATHRWFHSTASFPCPSSYQLVAPGDTPDPMGGAPDLAVSLILENMDRVLAFNNRTNYITVQAGMTVQQLLDAATAVNRSSPLGAVPAFAGITLGGALSTNAHGTGHKAISTLSDIVVELTWVDGKGTIRRSSRGSPEGRALCGGLGIVGVVTELTLALTEPTHTVATAARLVKDTDIVDDVMAMIKEHPHTLVVWRPDMEKYTAYSLEEVPTTVPNTGATAAIEVPPAVMDLLGQALGKWQADVENKLPIVEDIIGVAVMQTSVDHAWAVSPSGKPLYNAVGETNRMQAVGCGKQCAWEGGAGITFDDLHFTIELEQLPDWIADVKRVMEYDYWNREGRKGKLMPPGYFWLRFGDGNNDLISPNSGLKAPAHVQMSFMKSNSQPGSPGKYAWILETIEQLTICKYKGRPHWGKNTERAYTHPTCSIRSHYPKFDQLLASQSKFDPKKILQPSLFARIVAGAKPSYGQGCVLRGECYCTADEHCAQGHVCVPSFAFPEYNVCKPKVGW